MFKDNWTTFLIDLDETYLKVRSLTELTLLLLTDENSIDVSSASRGEVIEAPEFLHP